MTLSRVSKDLETIADQLKTLPAPSVNQIAIVEEETTVTVKQEVDGWWDWVRKNCAAAANTVTSIFGKTIATPRITSDDTKKTTEYLQRIFGPKKVLPREKYYKADIESIFLRAGEVTWSDLEDLFYKEIKNPEITQIRFLTRAETALLRINLCTFDRLDSCTKEALDRLIGILSPFAKIEHLFLHNVPKTTGMAQWLGGKVANVFLNRSLLLPLLPVAAHICLGSLPLSAVVGYATISMLFATLSKHGQQQTDEDRPRNRINLCHKMKQLSWDPMRDHRWTDCMGSELASYNIPNGLMIPHQDGYHRNFHLISKGGEHKYFLKEYGALNVPSLIVHRGMQVDDSTTFRDVLHPKIGDIGPRVNYDETISLLNDPSKGFIRKKGEKVGIIGMSLGGAQLTRWAAAHPEKFSHIVTVRSPMVEREVAQCFAKKVKEKQLHISMVHLLEAKDRIALCGGDARVGLDCPKELVTLHVCKISDQPKKETTCPKSCAWKVAATVGRSMGLLAGQICRLLPNQLHPVALYGQVIAPFETVKNHIREVFDRDIVITRLSNQFPDAAGQMKKFLYRGQSAPFWESLRRFSGTWIFPHSGSTFSQLMMTSP